jgi:hypothetical protein
VEKAAVSLKNRAVTAAVLIAATVSLSGCSGSGFSAQVDDVRADNAAGQVHDVLARAVVLVKGQAAPAAALAGTLINAGDRSDQLQTITLTDTAPGSPTVTLSPNLTLDPGQLLNLGVNGSPPITVPDASSLRLGDFVNVVLHFRNAGDLTLSVACVDRTYYFSDVLPTTAPSSNTQGDTTSSATKASKVTKTSAVATGKVATGKKAGRIATAIQEPSAAKPLVAVRKKAGSVARATEPAAKPPVAR